MSTRAIHQPATIKIRPETELVLGCIRGKVAEAEKQRILELLNENLNWPEVLAIAIEHKVVPLVFETLGAFGKDLAPTEWMDALKDNSRNVASRNLRLFAEMLTIVDTFRSNRLTAVSYKGPALGWLCFRNLARRTFDNLEFYLEQKFLPWATTLLKELGYLPHVYGNQDVNSSDPVSGPYSFFSVPGKVGVKVYTERTFSHWPGRLNLGEMSGRLQTIEIGGRKIPTFSLEDTLILSCVHGARHFWGQFSWLADVSGLISANIVDWEKAMRLAAEMKCRRMLLLGLCLAHEFVGAAVPDAVLSDGKHDSDILWLLREQRKHLFWKPGVVISGFARPLYRLRSQDGWRERLQCVPRSLKASAETGSPEESVEGTSSALRLLARPWKQLWNWRKTFRPSPELDLAEFLPMRREIVDQLLEFAGVKPEDVLFDLGCGDGRVVVAAAEKFGIRAVGVDLDPERISQARTNARKHGVQERVRFLQADAKQVDLSEATIVTLYMGMKGMLRIAPSLRERLRPGARIVSCDTGIFGWPCDEKIEHKSPEGDVVTLFLSRIDNVRIANTKADSFLQLRKSS